MKRILSILVIAFAMLTLACNKLAEPSEESIVEVKTDRSDAQPAFTLTASCGGPETKLCFDPDGLNTTWQPGDKLYIIDLSGKTQCVELTANITEPSKTASFTSTTSVLPGEYIVTYGTSSLKTTSSKNAILVPNDPSQRIILTAPLTVNEGQTSATIELKHALTKLTFTFQNIPTDIVDIQFGMASAKGIQISENVIITKEGLSSTYSPIQFFTKEPIDIFDHTTKAKTLIIPSDLSGENVYFFISGTNIQELPVVYEICKNGKNLKAGTNYNITLNFATANKTTLNKKNDYLILKSPLDFRAALYCKCQKLVIENDVDFKDETYIPIYENESSYVSIGGNYHVLNNVNINSENLEHVGIIGKGTAGAIIVKNATIKGKSIVGGIVGEGYASNCGFEGTIEATGNSIGGIVGKAYRQTNYYDQDKTVYIDNCYHLGNIIGGRCVGGIVGYSSYGHCRNCYNIGNIIGEKGCAGIGGVITNTGTAKCCYSYGEISSQDDKAYGITTTTIQTDSYNCLSNNYIREKDCEEHNCIQDCGPTNTFLSHLDIINTGQAYATQIWPNIDAGCPMLRWQADMFNGNITAPGMGDEDW